MPNYVQKKQNMWKQFRTHSSWPCLQHMLRIVAPEDHWTIWSIPKQPSPKQGDHLHQWIWDAFFPECKILSFFWWITQETPVDKLEATMVVVAHHRRRLGVLHHALMQNFSKKLEFLFFGCGSGAWQKLDLESMASPVEPHTGAKSQANRL